jgi:hypothetical protein
MKTIAALVFVLTAGPLAAQTGAQQATQANQQAIETFKKAAGACLEGPATR